MSQTRPTTPFGRRPLSLAMMAAQAAVVVAGILRRGPAIAAPGAYLRDLAGKARAGRFSAWPMVMRCGGCGRG